MATLVITKIDEIQILKGELPMEVADLEDEIAGLETRTKKLRTGVKDAEAEITKIQTTAKDAENNIKRYQKQLEEVKNNREYEALQKEIELAKLDIQLSEKKVREAKAGLLQVLCAKCNRKKGKPAAPGFKDGEDDQFSLFTPDNTSEKYTPDKPYEWPTDDNTPF